VKKKLRLKPLTEGKGQGEYGVFDGDTILGQVDEESVRECAEDLARRLKERGPRGQNAANAIVDEDTREAKQLVEFMSENFHLVESFSDELALLILNEMRNTGHGYSIAFKTVTMTPRGAELWAAHERSGR
jgi:hypothetical protein